MDERFVYMDFTIPIEAYGGVAGFADVELEIETKRIQEGIYEWDISTAFIGPHGEKLREPSGEDLDSLIRRMEVDFKDVIDMQVSWTWEDVDG